MKSRALTVVAGCLVWVTAATAQPRAIDIEKSVMTVRVYKAGLLSGLGHEHEISAPLAGGTVDMTSHRVELHTNARSLRVVDQGISDKDRAEIQSNMLGPPVLDADLFPEIVFRSTNAASAGNGYWTVNGNLTLHGQTHAAILNVPEAAGHFTGVTRLKQSDFGITPIKVAGGAVRVKDEIQIEFDIQLAR
jgi:polyisoprenoid-binding protein YceI